MGACPRVTPGCSYNKTLNEILVDSGFGGGVAVGARSPGHVTTATSYRALGDQVSSTASRSTSGNGTNAGSATDNSAVNITALCSKR